MRLALLLIILIETTFIGVTLGQAADHYAYLESVYLNGLDTADHAVASCQLRCPR